MRRGEELDDRQKMYKRVKVYYCPGSRVICPGLNVSLATGLAWSANTQGKRQLQNDL